MQSSRLLRLQTDHTPSEACRLWTLFLQKIVRLHLLAVRQWPSMSNYYLVTISLMYTLHHYFPAIPDIR